jgi:hypothetical protein
MIMGPIRYTLLARANSNFTSQISRTVRGLPRFSGRELLLLLEAGTLRAGTKQRLEKAVAE